MSELEPMPINRTAYDPATGKTFIEYENGKTYLHDTGVNSLGSKEITLTKDDEEKLNWHQVRQTE